MALPSGNISGGVSTRGRVLNDFYATPSNATEALFKVEKFEGNVWECACGDGAMSKIIEKYNTCFNSDLIDRGYGIPNIDFLNSNFSDIGMKTCDNIITNPPFSLFQEFAAKALSVVKKKVVLFGKLHALEGNKRATFLQNSPLRTVYVFKNRVNTLRNGEATDENGKPWATTIAFAWFVWEIGYAGKPMIDWVSGR